jgi:branched-chain amino acid aminotransferase
MSGVGFGTLFSNHMLTMEWETGKGWHNEQIQPFGPLSLAPSALVLHYGQEAFEGLKAYQADEGKATLFRPRLNFERMNKTARRMCLPELDVEATLDALKQLIRQDRDWIPTEPGTSLYIRPTLIATEEFLGLKVSSKYLFYIILSPVGPYYPEGFNPVKITVCTAYVRAAPGGVGEAKTGGNYAASNLAEKEAKESGFTQVLWLDAVERRFVEEVGAMNIFFVIDGELHTPQLTGTILPGITRRSVIELAQHWEMTVVERRIPIDEVQERISNGSLTEVFGSGTAAVISPVSLLNFKDQNLVIGDGQTGPIAQKFFQHLTDLQYGRIDDPFGWIEPLE